MHVPELLVTLSGERVKNAEEWETFRRKEIKVLLEEYLYGRRPVERPEGLVFSVKKAEENYGGEKLDFAQVEASFPGFSFVFYGFYPQKKTPARAFVYIMHEHIEEWSDFLHDLHNAYVPIADITARGYAVFVVTTGQINPDWYHRYPYFRRGVFAVLSPDYKNRRGGDWGSLSSWGWAASRVMDYLETDPRVDKENVAVGGLSRSGKAALICGAWDERFRLTISNASGCLGASLLRDRVGEHIKNLDKTDWFCDNLKMFHDREDLFPVDQHMVLAMIAPRLLYVQSCTDDEWADPGNERRSCVLASEVYEKLYGLPGAVLPQEVQPDTPYHEGTIGYHLTTGEHGTQATDWQYFMDFWEKH